MEHAIQIFLCRFQAYNIDGYFTQDDYQIFRQQVQEYYQHRAQSHHRRKKRRQTRKQQQLGRQNLI